MKARRLFFGRVESLSTPFLYLPGRYRLRIKSRRKGKETEDAKEIDAHKKV
jgi:hypothetical protein